MYLSKHIFKQKWGCTVHIEFCIHVLQTFGKVISWKYHFHFATLLCSRARIGSFDLPDKIQIPRPGSSLGHISCIQLPIETHLPNCRLYSLCSFHDSWIWLWSGTDLGFGLLPSYYNNSCVTLDTCGMELLCRWWDNVCKLPGI